MKKIKVNLRDVVDTVRAEFVPKDRSSTNLTDKDVQQSGGLVSWAQGANAQVAKNNRNAAIVAGVIGVGLMATYFMGGKKS